jgi:hypothetical protein
MPVGRQMTDGHTHHHSATNGDIDGDRDGNAVPVRW